MDRDSLRSTEEDSSSVLIGSLQEELLAQAGGFIDASDMEILKELQYRIYSGMTVLVRILADYISVSCPK